MLLEHSLDAPEAARSIGEAVSAVLDAGYRSADLILAGEDREATGCVALGDRVLEQLDAAR
jgi:isocitrate/isopropylmalate dehydrogenase